MPTYRRRTRVAAPLASVWEFHSRVDGLLRLTPSWLHLRIEAVENPDGERDPDVLERGTRIRMSVRPFDVGPRRRWVSRIRDRRTYDGGAYFVDDMQEGPLREWVHRHAFVADGDETILVDEVRYRLPFCSGGEALGPVVNAGFEAAFRYRHARTKRLLETT